MRGGYLQYSFTGCLHSTKYCAVPWVGTVNLSMALTVHLERQAKVVGRLLSVGKEMRRDIEAET